MTLEQGQVPLDNLISLRTAHDVRRLRSCQSCKGLGDKDCMIVGDQSGFFHGRCYANAYGVDALLALDNDDLRDLQLGDLGVDLMRKVIEEVNGR